MPPHTDTSQASQKNTCEVQLQMHPLPPLADHLVLPALRSVPPPALYMVPPSTKSPYVVAPHFCSSGKSSLPSCPFLCDQVRPLVKTTAVTPATQSPPRAGSCLAPTFQYTALHSTLRVPFPAGCLLVPIQANALPVPPGFCGFCSSFDPALICPSLVWPKEVPVSTSVTACSSDLLGQFIFYDYLFSITTNEIS